tara:strand:- start:379 stop:570 length:192 start_codon:yes stop_codon:yes gene_type:complete
MKTREWNFPKPDVGTEEAASSSPKKLTDVEQGLIQAMEDAKRQAEEEKKQSGNWIADQILGIK